MIDQTLQRVADAWVSVSLENQQHVSTSMFYYARVNLGIRVVDTAEAALAIERNCAGGLAAFIKDITEIHSERMPPTSP